MSRRTRPSRDPECQRVIDAAGDQTIIAIALGTTRDAIAHWLRVPAEYALRLEQLTGIPAREIRPDMYLPLNPVAETRELRAEQHAALMRARHQRTALRGSQRRLSPKANPPAVESGQGAIGD